jgi:hypothetical protein
MRIMNTIFGKRDYAQFPFWVFTISVFIIAILPSLIQDGMFIDGIQYAAVSKNLANGLGTFWAPYMSQNWYTMGSGVFLEHPPLVYAIQGLFFMSSLEASLSPVSLLYSDIKRVEIVQIWALYEVVFQCLFPNNLIARSTGCLGDRDCRKFLENWTLSLTYCNFMNYRLKDVFLRPTVMR